MICFDFFMKQSFGECFGCAYHAHITEIVCFSSPLSMEILHFNFAQCAHCFSQDFSSHFSCGFEPSMGTLSGFYI